MIILNSLTETGKFDRVKIMVNGEDGTKNLGKFYKRNTGIQKKGYCILKTCNNLFYYMLK